LLFAWVFDQSWSQVQSFSSLLLRRTFCCCCSPPLFMPFLIAHPPFWSQCWCEWLLIIM
jgi:hypothetical protein